MIVTASTELNVKPEAMADLKAILREILPDTRNYVGCRGVEVYSVQGDESIIVLLSQWDSRDHHARYVEWRKKTGVLDRMGVTFAGPPVVRYFERVNI